MAVIKKLMEGKHPVVVCPSKADLSCFEKEERVAIPKVFRARIAYVLPGEKGKQCTVRIRFGMGQEMDVRARSVIRWVGCGDKGTAWI